MSAPKDFDLTVNLPIPGGEADLRSRQWAKLRALLTKISYSDNFNSRRLKAVGISNLSSEINSLSEFIMRVPFCNKEDLLADRQASPPFGTNFTEPPQRYTRFCQTTGTSTGQPVAMIDTPESWDAMLACWRQVYKGAGVKPGERIFFAFSFGPFLGFWTAFDAAARDCMVLPGGGLSTQARLEMMARYQATTLCCTPTYALRLGEHVGAPSGIGLNQLKIKRIIVAGEPGGSLPTTRDKIRQLWGGAKVFDHHGMTEVGPVSFEEAENPGSLCVIEDAYFAEIIDPRTGHEVDDREEGELVLTTLTRTAAPLLRYRTGDWVCKHLIHDKLYLEAGVLGRCDDMAVIRGVNIYPSAIENVVRRFDEVAEFQIEQRTVDGMDEVEVVVELEAGVEDDVLDRIAHRLRDTFSLRIPVRPATPGSLPRFDFKARRWRKV